MPTHVHLEKWPLKRRKKKVIAAAGCSIISISNIINHQSSSSVMTIIIITVILLTGMKHNRLRDTIHCRQLCNKTNMYLPFSKACSSRSVINYV